MVVSSVKFTGWFRTEKAPLSVEDRVLAERRREFARLKPKLPYNFIILDEDKFIKGPMLDTLLAIEKEQIEEAERQRRKASPSSGFFSRMYQAVKTSVETVTTGIQNLLSSLSNIQPSPSQEKEASNFTSQELKPQTSPPPPVLEPTLEKENVQSISTTSVSSTNTSPNIAAPTVPNIPVIKTKPSDVSEDDAPGPQADLFTPRDYLKALMAKTENEINRQIDTDPFSVFDISSHEAFSELTTRYEVLERGLNHLTQSPAPSGSAKRLGDLKIQLKRAYAKCLSHFVDHLLRQSPVTLQQQAVEEPDKILGVFPTSRKSEVKAAYEQIRAEIDRERADLQQKIDVYNTEKRDAQRKGASTMPAPLPLKKPSWLFLITWKELLTLRIANGLLVEHLPV